MRLTFEDSLIQFTSWELSRCLRIPRRTCMDELPWGKAAFEGIDQSAGHVFLCQDRFWLQFSVH